MKSATTAQKRKIHVCAAERGMDSELLHHFVYGVVKKASLKELTIQDAVIIIDNLEGKKHDTNHATHKQIAFIQSLAKEVGWTDEKRINSYIKEYYKVEHIKFLTKRDASKVIEALKAMNKRAKAE